MRIKSAPMPRLPAAARKAGATQIARCNTCTFTVGFAIDGDYTTENLSRPGRGQAVYDALVAWAGDDYAVEWKGEQRFGVILTAR